MNSPTTPRWQIAAQAAAALLVALAIPRAQAQQAAPRAQLSTPIETHLRLVDQPRPRTVLLVGREGRERLLYRPEGAPEGSTAGINTETVVAAEFVFSVDEHAAYGAAREGNWTGGAQQILSSIGPTLPFLDLPNNNATDYALTAGRYLMRAGFTAMIEEDAEQRARAPALYRAAAQVLRAAGRADWHMRSEIAQARSALALIRAGDTRGGARALERMRTPLQGDASYGAYWLAQAQLMVNRDELRAGLDAAIRSYIYENKDVEVMPEALLLAAQCYEDLLEIHRTRDVYYEVARLFRGTAWGALALRRLRVIMDEGLTAEDEPRDVAAVFFGREEDMNALARELIEQADAGRPTVRRSAWDDDEEDEDEGEP